MSSVISTQESCVCVHTIRQTGQNFLLWFKKKVIVMNFFMFFSLEGNYTVTTMKGGAAVSFQQKSAEDFLQSRLYGPGCLRTTSQKTYPHLSTFLFESCFSYHFFL